MELLKDEKLLKNDILIIFNYHYFRIPDKLILYLQAEFFLLIIIFQKVIKLTLFSRSAVLICLLKGNKLPQI